MDIPVREEIELLQQFALKLAEMAILRFLNFVMTIQMTVMDAHPVV